MLHATPAQAANTSGTIACSVVYETSVRSDSGVAKYPANSIQRLEGDDDDDDGGAPGDPAFSAGGHHRSPRSVSTASTRR